MPIIQITDTHMILYVYILSTSCQIHIHIAYFGLPANSSCLLSSLPIAPSHTGAMGGNVISKLLLQRVKFLSDGIGREKPRDEELYTDLDKLLQCNNRGNFPI